MYVRMYLSIHLSVYPSIRLSYLSTYLSTCLLVLSTIGCPEFELITDRSNSGPMHDCHYVDIIRSFATTTASEGHRTLCCLNEAGKS